MTPDLQSFADEFLASQQFLLGEFSCQQDASILLHTFITALPPGGMTIVTFEAALLDHIPRLDCPFATKRGIPTLLKAFFSWCADSGAWPPARTWIGWLDMLEKRYLEKFREDGSVKGETFKKKYTDVSRNDPCPCGSGKKFKKCCWGILG